MLLRRPDRKLFVSALCLTASVALLVGAAAAPTTQPKAFPEVPNPHLHNAHVVTDKIISGAQPDDEAAFAALKALGVRTIISVDGAAPDVATAKKYGMRYVHLPIGYDGVDREEGKAIAKALNELPGPIYLHCHHGKHRSAAAVAVACVYNGMLPPARAESVLKTFGTGLNYKGLWQASRDARPLDPAELRALRVDYVETAKITDMAARMVKVDQHWDHVKHVKAAHWKPPADHPDLDPAHEVLQVQEHLRESARLESAVAHPAEFFKMLRQSESDCESLRKTLSAQPVDARAADKAFNAIAESCTSCHKAYRD